MINMVCLFHIKNNMKLWASDYYEISAWGIAQYIYIYIYRYIGLESSHYIAIAMWPPQ